MVKAAGQLLVLWPKLPSSLRSHWLLWPGEDGRLRIDCHGKTLCWLNYSLCSQKKKSSHGFQRKKKSPLTKHVLKSLAKYLLSIKRERIPLTICCDSLVLYQSPTKQLLVDFQCIVCTPWQFSCHCTNSVMPYLFHSLLMSKLARTTPEHCWEAIPSNFSSCGSDPYSKWLWENCIRPPFGRGIQQPTSAPSGQLLSGVSVFCRRNPTWPVSKTAFPGAS